MEEGPSIDLQCFLAKLPFGSICPSDNHDAILACQNSTSP